jgi:hypothetical protein
MSAFVINPYSFVSDNITTFEFLQLTASAGDATNYNLTNVNFGTADANRRILIAVLSRSGGTTSFSSATIGGVSATILEQQTLAYSGSHNHVYLTADVPTGASGTVSLTFSSNQARVQIATYRVISATALVLADAQNSVNTSASSLSVSVAAENGIVLASAASLKGTVELSVSGIANTDSNSVLESNTNMLFASERTTATATQTVTASLASGTGISLLGVCLK